MSTLSIRTHISRITLSLTRTVPVVILMFIWVSLGVLSAYQPLAVLLLMGLPLGLGLILWPTVTLGLYVNAAFFKADPRLNSLTGPVDMTVALAAALIGAIAYRLVLRRERFMWSSEISLALTFAGLILLGVLFTPAYTYGTEKAFRFVSLTLLAFFTPIVVVKSYQSVKLFFFVYLGLAIVATLGTLTQLDSAQSVSAFGTTTISTSRTIGVGVIILIFVVLMGRVARLWQILAVAGLGVMLLAMIGTGSRGPLLTLIGVVALTFSLTMAKPSGRTRIFLILGILAVATLGAFASGLIPPSSLERFDSLKEGGADTSANARLQVMAVAWQLFTSSPILGRGIGSVSVFGAGREQIYPHNILLELAAETGLVGLGLFLILMGRILWQLLIRLLEESNQGSLWLTLLAMLLFSLLNAMVSGDLNDGRDLWLLAGLTIAVTKVKRETG